MPLSAPFRRLRRAERDVVQVVPGWGRFCFSMEKQCTRVVFHDRTLLTLRAGGTVDMLLPDGTPVSGTVEFLVHQASLRPHVLAGAEFHAWATGGEPLPVAVRGCGRDGTDASPPTRPQQWLDASLSAVSSVLSSPGLLHEVAATLQASASTLAILEANAVGDSRV